MSSTMHGQPLIKSKNEARPTLKIIKTETGKTDDNKGVQSLNINNTTTKTAT